MMKKKKTMHLLYSHLTVLAVPNWMLIEKYTENIKLYLLNLYFWKNLWQVNIGVES